MYKREYTYVVRQGHMNQPCGFRAAIEYEGESGLGAIKLASCCFSKCNQSVASFLKDFESHGSLTNRTTQDAFSAQTYSAEKIGLIPCLDTHTEHLASKAWLRESRALLHRLPNQIENASTAFHPSINTVLQ